MRGHDKLSDLKSVIANNIQSLRKAYPMTQAELAEKLNYSDKAVSKWERAESIPDVEILCDIASIFEVSLDYLVTSHEEEIKIKRHKPVSARNRVIITLLSIALVWLLATVGVIVVNYCIDSFPYLWVILAGAAIISLIVALVFNSIWGIRVLSYIIITLLMWGLITILYFVFFSNYTLFFALGAPGQIIIVLWSFLSFKRKKT